MTTRIVDEFEKWLILKQYLIDSGYKLWQTQYGSDSPEGYHARFMNVDKHVEVITHSKDIETDIRESNL